MTRPLSGLRVWVTRPLPSAAASARVWHEAGADAVVVPLVHFAPQALSNADRDRLASLPRPWTVVLTSQNAARFLAQALQPYPDLHAALGEATAFAVGDATADQARGLGLRVVETASRATGADLARLLIERLPAPASVVLPGSDLQRPLVSDELTRAGIGVTSVVAYHTLAVSSIERALAAELGSDPGPVVLLYSPSAVQSLLGILQAEHLPTARVAVGAVGPTTRQAAAQAGLQVVAAPDSPGEASLVQSVAAWWSGRLS